MLVFLQLGVWIFGDFLTFRSMVHGLWNRKLKYRAFEFLIYLLSSYVEEGIFRLTT